MRQSDIIFAGVAIGFLIYITVRGQLGSYASLLVGQKGQSTATKADASVAGTSTSAGSGTGSSGLPSWMTDAIELSAYTLG